MWGRRQILAALFILLSGAIANAQAPVREWHSFESVTLSDADFLNGGTEGKQATLKGQLQIPASGEQALPAVVLLHGSAGYSSSPILRWAGRLNEIGIATFTIDSFSGRNLSDTTADQAQLGRLAMVMDAYRALAILAQDPRIDLTRIAVMGLSRGGRAAVNSSVTRFQTMHAPAGLRFAAHIGLYTPCDTVYRGDDDVAAPILLLHGTADTYVSIEPCRSYASRLAAAGKDIRLIEYEGAGHVFDAPDLVTPVMLPKAQTTRHCRMIEGDDGVILNQDTQQAFSYGDACVEHGPTIAYNGAADRKALADITAFLERVFALK